MTLALSNFMRQAAREDILAYSICSAVLEGTTTDRGTYNPYYEKSAELYGIPQAKRSRRSTRTSISTCSTSTRISSSTSSRQVESMSAERAALVLDYGHQLVEHIWLWTDNIEKYYQNESNPMPRRAVRRRRSTERIVEMSAMSGHDLTMPIDYPFLKRTATVSRENGSVAHRHLRDEITLEGARARSSSASCSRTSTARRALEAIADGSRRSRARLRALARPAREAPACVGVPSANGAERA